MINHKIFLKYYLNICIATWKQMFKYSLQIDFYISIQIMCFTVVFSQHVSLDRFSYTLSTLPSSCPLLPSGWFLYTVPISALMSHAFHCPVLSLPPHLKWYYMQYLWERADRHKGKCCHSHMSTQINLSRWLCKCAVWNSHWEMKPAQTISCAWLTNTPVHLRKS